MLSRMLSVDKLSYVVRNSGYLNVGVKTVYLMPVGFSERAQMGRASPCKDSARHLNLRLSRPVSSHIDRIQPSAQKLLRC